MVFNASDDRCVNPDKKPGIDEACLTIFNNGSNPVTVYSFFDDCRACDGLPFANLSEHSSSTLVVPTCFRLHMYFTENRLQWCHGSYKFVEHGRYGWNLTDRSCSPFYVIEEQWDPNIPVLAMFSICLSLFVSYCALTPICAAIKRAMARRSNQQSDEEILTDPEPSPPPSVPLVNGSRSSTRIHSIDTFRGIAILMMIFVNNGGGKYVYFNHSPWYGLTVADLVLPWFAWIMGLTLVVSLRTQLRISVSRPRITLRALRRSLLLILFGLLINSDEDTTVRNLRFPGVLQLLGITYFICATIEAAFMKAQRNFQFGRLAFVQDILDCWPQWILIATFATAHTLLTFLLPVPGCPTGYLGPGGWDRRGKYVSCTGGAAGYVDRLVFGSHMYNKTHNPIYGPTLPHDPEGLMNTLSAILLVALGVQAGRIMLHYLQLPSKILRWVIWAIITGITAGFLCDWEMEGGVVPLSKNMMTISFVLATSSLAFILFAILFYIIDHKQIWNGAPFVYSGMNPIFLYVGHYLTMNHFPWSLKIEHPGAHGPLFYMNLWTTILWALIAYGLYRKNIIITI